VRIWAFLGKGKGKGSSKTREKEEGSKSECVSKNARGAVKKNDESDVHLPQR
jgi:hypothetical protein